MLATRHANPFATCWTRPGSLPWVAADGVRADCVVGEFDRVLSGQIVGPHGVGKSTLIEAVADRLTARGDRILRWTLNGYLGAVPPPDLARDAVLLVDGLEQLGPLRTRLLLARCNWARTRLIATTHKPLRLPVLARLQPSLTNALRLFDKLVAVRSTPVLREDAAESYHRCNGNIRDVWFDLYDLHERLSRERRTRAGLAP